MEENNGIKIAHVINLPTLNLKAQLNMNVDSNTHIKQVLNIDACLIEAEIEPLFNKAVIKGKVGIKVLYIDIDGMYNTLADTINFNENISNESITTDCEIIINNSQFLTNFNYDDKTLHITIEGNIDCFCNLNSGFNAFNQINDNLVVKKSLLQACSCVQKINKDISFDCDFKLDSKMNKLLSCESQIIVEENKCYNGYVVINGQIINNIIYEFENEGSSLIKLFTNTTPFKIEVEASNCDSECLADMSAYINFDSTQINTDIGDNYTNISFEYCIVTSGYVYKNINVDIVEDLYSLDSEVETIDGDYAICKKLPYFKSTENVDTEITLADDLNVDEIIGMINTSSNITKQSTNQGLLTIEGVINGNMLYLDENKQLHHLPTQVPYLVNIKQDFNEDICASHLCIVPTNCKCKIKRGNTLIVDYEICVNGNMYAKNSVKIIENVKYGKVIDYKDIAFQIFVAHNNESQWDLCKRLHITSDKLCEFNKENPPTYMGGEKIIVYR